MIKNSKESLVKIYIQPSLINLKIIFFNDNKIN